MEYTLENEYVTFTVGTHGAELTSLKHNDVEYLWYADKEFWGRHAPVLFPFVGLVRNKEYRYKGVTYPMGQHGFARDNEFTLVEKTEDKIYFEFSATEETKKVYPFDFSLTVGYELVGNQVKVVWKVTSDEEIFFSIGGHPAFLCPVDHQGQWEDYKLLLEKDGAPVHDVTVHECVDGLVPDHTHPLHMEDGTLIPSVELFADDALIIEDQELDAVSLISPAGNNFLKVKFDTPLVGIWAPPVGKQVPFICIEPWYGRADASDFDGDLTERKYGNHLNAGEEFVGGYTIELNDI